MSKVSADSPSENTFWPYLRLYRWPVYRGGSSVLAALISFAEEQFAKGKSPSIRECTISRNSLAKRTKLDPTTVSEHLKLLCNGDAEKGIPPIVEKLASKSTTEKRTYLILPALNFGKKSDGGEPFLPLPKNALILANQNRVLRRTYGDDKLIEDFREKHFGKGRKAKSFSVNEQLAYGTLLRKVNAAASKSARFKFNGGVNRLLRVVKRLHAVSLTAAGIPADQHDGFKCISRKSLCEAMHHLRLREMVEADRIGSKTIITVAKLPHFQRGAR